MYKNSPKTASTPILDRYFAYGGILSSCTLNDLKIRELLHRPKIKYSLLINIIVLWVLEKGELFCTQKTK
jgi:hypothetical protein